MPKVRAARHGPDRAAQSAVGYSIATPPASLAWDRRASSSANVLQGAVGHRRREGFFCTLAVTVLALAGLGAIGAALDAAVLWAFKVPGWWDMALWSIPFTGCGA